MAKMELVKGWLFYMVLRLGFELGLGQGVSWDGKGYDEGLGNNFSQWKSSQG